MPKKAKTELLTLGEGPPYRITGILTEKWGTIDRPVPCDHCGRLLTAKQVLIEDQAGEEFVIGSSCAKKLGGQRLARWVKELEEEEALRVLAELVEERKRLLSEVAYGRVSQAFPYGKWSFPKIRKWEEAYWNKGLLHKKTGYDWARDMLKAGMTAKEQGEFSQFLTDPVGYVEDYEEAKGR